MKLSNKKKSQLYDVIHEEIMIVRIEVAKHPSKTISIDLINTLLSKLCYSASQKAIEIFNP